MDTFLDNVIDPSFLAGIIFMLTGTIMLLWPPKKPNVLYGYRTMSSMKSQERWEFAQRFSSIKLVQAGAVIFAVSLIGYFIAGDMRTAIGIFTMLAGIGFMFITTERAIKKKFTGKP